MNGTRRPAIDVGGSFTDVVELRAGRLRVDNVPTTPQAPTEGVLNAVDVAEAGAAGVTMFTHGTTLGLNTLLTRSGARTAVVGTAGFRDVYLLGRTDHRTNYDITYHRGGAGVSRAYRFTAPSTGICLVYKTRTKPWPIGGAVRGRTTGSCSTPVPISRWCRAAATTGSTRGRCW
jgi:N-methylhydantoinase A